MPPPRESAVISWRGQNARCELAGSFAGFSGGWPAPPRVFDCVKLIVYSQGVLGRIEHKGLADLHRTGKTRRIGADRVRKCIRILQLLDAASKPEDMSIMGLHFHALEGAPKRWSVRVTANYRITFGWSGESAVDVDLEDYH